MLFGRGSDLLDQCLIHKSLLKTNNEEIVLSEALQEIIEVEQENTSRY